MQNEPHHAIQRKILVQWGSTQFFRHFQLFMVTARWHQQQWWHTTTTRQTVLTLLARSARTSALLPMDPLNASHQCGQEDFFGFAGASILETCDPSKHSACRACGTESLPARGSSDVAESEHDLRTWTNGELLEFQRCAARKERFAVKSLSTVPAG